MYTLTAILIMVSLLTGGAIAMLIMIAVRLGLMVELLRQIRDESRRGRL